MKTKLIGPMKQMNPWAQGLIAVSVLSIIATTISISYNPTPPNADGKIEKTSKTWPQYKMTMGPTIDEPVIEPKEKNNPLKTIWVSRTQGSKADVIYGRNYTSGGLLFAGAANQAGDWVPFLDLRGHGFDNGGWAANAGLVGRYIAKNCSTIAGVNAYYDARGTQNNNTYQGLGIGLELLAKHWDLRANGYFPMGNRVNIECCRFQQTREVATTGFNAEVGYKILGKDYYLYTGIGPYYFKGNETKGITGGIFRIRPQYKNIVGLDLSTSYDNLVHWNFQGILVLSLPLYRCSSWKKEATEAACFSKCNIYQPVQRFDVMQISTEESCGRNWSVAGSNR